jgi:hypothetical protein
MIARTATARQIVAPRIETPPPTPRLRIARPDAPSTTPRRRSRQWFRPVTVATALVVASLLAVVTGNMLLASGQLQLEKLQANLAATESKYAGKLERFTEAQSPAAAAGVARDYKLVPPLFVLPIQAVSLAHRLAAPTLSSAPCCTLTPGR